MRMPNDDEQVIFVKSYRSRSGKLMIAAHFGLQAFRLVVKKKKN
jgi:hypothetical protein